MLGLSLVSSLVGPRPQQTQAQFESRPTGCPPRRDMQIAHILPSLCRSLPSLPTGTLPSLFQSPLPTALGAFAPPASLFHRPPHTPRPCCLADPPPCTAPHPACPQVTRERIRQIEAKAIRKLRSPSRIGQMLYSS